MVDFSIPYVMDVRHAGGYVLWLRFKDGVEGEIDLGDAVRAEVGVLHTLADRALFSQARAEGGAVAWPNGADWAPETLYDRLLATKQPQAQSSGDGEVSRPTQRGDLPEISRFFGIVIRMFFDDHARPHFHAQCGEHAMSFEIDGDGLQGSLPQARLPLVFEWRDRHRAELRENCERLRRGEQTNPIAPLE